MRGVMTVDTTPVSCTFAASEPTPYRYQTPNSSPPVTVPANPSEVPARKMTLKVKVPASTAKRDQP